MAATSKDTIHQAALAAEVTSAVKLATYTFYGLDASDEALDALCDTVLAEKIEPLNKTCRTKH